MSPAFWWPNLAARPENTPHPQQCVIATPQADLLELTLEAATALSPSDDPVGHLVYSLHGAAGRPGSHVLLQAEAGRVHSRRPEEDLETLSGSSSDDPIPYILLVVDCDSPNQWKFPHMSIKAPALSQLLPDQ